MKVSTVKACPTLRGLLASVDDKAARAVPGVIDVIRIANAVAWSANISGRPSNNLIECVAEPAYDFPNL